MNTKHIVDKMKLWKTVKSFFSDKLDNFESITLVENDSIVSDGNQIVTIFSEYFNNLEEGLNFRTPLVNHYSKGEDPNSSGILKY